MTTTDATVTDPESLDLSTEFESLRAPEEIQLATPRSVLDTAYESLRTSRMMLSDATKSLSKLESDALKVAAAARSAVLLPLSMVDGEDRSLLLAAAKSRVAHALRLVREARDSVTEWTRNVAEITKTVERHECLETERSAQS
jgi:hypothetical protein